MLVIAFGKLHTQYIGMLLIQLEKLKGRESLIKIISSESNN